MTQVLITESYLTDIADAIRAKNGSESEYSPADMADAIDAIEDASSVLLGAKTIASNGPYSAAADDLDGYSSVTVNVPNTYAQADEGKVVQNGALAAQTALTVTENGTYDTTAKNSVTVDVESSGGGGGNNGFTHGYARPPSLVLPSMSATAGETPAE